MSLTKLLLAAAISVAAVGAHAVPTYSVSTVAGSYGVSTAWTATGNAGVTTTADSNHATPDGVAGGAAYYFAGPDGTLTLAAGGSSFSFLWGSVDSFNKVSFNTTAGTYDYSGADLMSAFGTQQGTSTVFTATLAGATINSVSFTSERPAFELAVAAPVPEPETYALMGAGLLAVGFVARRKQR